MEAVKDQLTLVRAFLRLIEIDPTARRYLRLVLIGEGPLREKALRLLTAADSAQLAWLPGERSDIPEMMHGLDLFVLPSLREGISNTILEAMASGLPVLATAVGGNPELVSAGRTGLLVPPGDVEAMAQGLSAWATRPDSARALGQAGRERVMRRFSLQAMIDGYLTVYRAGSPPT
jgi:glycosyltransferase involved in cell wall biosynthesis